MAWSLVGVGTLATAASGNLTMNDPGGSQGDLIVASIAYRSSEPFTLPTGWEIAATQQSSGDIDDTSGIASGLMAWIIRGAAAPDLVFPRTNGNIALGNCVVYSGQSASPYDTGVAETLAVIGEPTASAITTAEGGELICAMVASGDANNVAQFNATDPGTTSGSTTDTTTDPTNGTWLRRHNNITATGADVGLSYADAVKVTAGSTGAFTANDPTGSTRSVMIVAAFKAASVSAAPRVGGLSLGFYLGL